MRKKAVLLKNALGVIIAVIGIALLVVGCSRGYKLLTGAEEERAIEIADTIVNKIGLLNIGESANLTIIGIKSGDWVITGWSKQDTDKPEVGECFLKTCICIYKEGFQNRKEGCENGGISRGFEVSKIEVGEIYLTEQIKLPTEEEMNEEADRILAGEEEISTERYLVKTIDRIKLPTNAIQLQLEKQENEIKIISFDDNYLSNYATYKQQGKIIEDA